MTGTFSHVDRAGQARMVDVGDKAISERRATARARVFMRPATLTMIADGAAAKGDVLAVARIAGILAAKRTADLIPLCHPLPLTAVRIDLALDGVLGAVEIIADCRVSARTGVEMEALTAATVAALTVYDMCKAVDRDMRIGDVELLHKTGGRSGTHGSPPPEAEPA